MPREIEQYLQYFCGDAADPVALDTTEPLRIAFYKAVVVFVRAFSAISQNLEEAGFTTEEINKLNNEVQFYIDVRAAIKNHSGEELDIKPYEADMRHLLNTYVQAEPAASLGNIDDYTLIELIVETGIHDAIVKKLNAKGRLTRNSIAEGIINNIRKTIIRDQLTDPRFYAEMSKLLEDLIKLKSDETVAYEQFLKQAEELAKRMASKNGAHPYPTILNGQTEAIVLYNNLPTIPADTFICPAEDNERAILALEIDRAMLEHAPADWKGDDTREKQVLNALFPLLNRDRKATAALFEIIKNLPGYA